MNLRAWMDEKGLSIKTVAKEAGASPSAVKKWLAGERFPRRQYLLRLNTMTNGKVTSNDFI